jgi:hypothetical protein
MTCHLHGFTKLPITSSADETAITEYRVLSADPLPANLAVGDDLMLSRVPLRPAAQLAEIPVAH